MPASPLSIVAFVLMSLLLLILIPFSTSAAPMGPQEPASSQSGMTRKEIFDIIFAPIFVLFYIGTVGWYQGWWSFALLVATNRLRAACRPLIEMASSLRHKALFQGLADAIVGTSGATPTSQTDGGATESAPRSLGQSAPPAGIVAVPCRAGSDYRH